MDEALIGGLYLSLRSSTSVAIVLFRPSSGCKKLAGVAIFAAKP